jgi:enoyl-CoA hydratase/carnithine racemase
MPLALARAAELGRAPHMAFAQIKAAVRQPVLRALQDSRAETERWLDSWFSPAGQARVREAVARLGGHK